MQRWTPARDFRKGWKDHERRPDIEISTAILLLREKVSGRESDSGGGRQDFWRLSGKFHPRLCRHAGTIVNAGTDLMFGHRPRSDRVLLTCFVRRFTREPWVQCRCGAWPWARCVARMRESGSSQFHSPNAGDILGSEHHAVHAGGGEKVFSILGNLAV